MTNQHTKFEDSRPYPSPVIDRKPSIYRQTDWQADMWKAIYPHFFQKWGIKIEKKALYVRELIMYILDVYISYLNVVLNYEKSRYYELFLHVTVRNVVYFHWILFGEVSHLSYKYNFLY